MLGNGGYVRRCRELGDLAVGGGLAVMAVHEASGTSGTGPSLGYSARFAAGLTCLEADDPDTGAKRAQA